MHASAIIRFKSGFPSKFACCLLNKLNILFTPKKSYKRICSWLLILLLVYQVQGEILVSDVSDSMFQWCKFFHIFHTNKIVQVEKIKPN